MLKETALLINKKKGVEIVKTDDSSRISVTIGNTTLKPQGHPTSVRFEKQTAHVYLIMDTSGSL